MLIVARASTPGLASKFRQLEMFCFVLFFSTIPLGFGSEITAKREGIMQINIIINCLLLR